MDFRIVLMCPVVLLKIMLYCFLGGSLGFSTLTFMSSKNRDNFIVLLLICMLRFACGLKS